MARILWGLFALAAVAIGSQYVTSGQLDFSVYRDAGLVLRADSSSLYSHVFSNGLLFTYPPFAAAMFAALSVGPESEAGWLWFAVSIAALARVSVIVAAWVRGRGLLVRVPDPLVGPLLACASLATEPYTSTLSYGQINILLMWLVLEDLARPATSRAAGVLTGLATGVKLTPGLFIVFSAAIGRVRQTVVAATTFAATIAVGWLILPAASGQYWIVRRFLDDSRMGPADYIGNQSVNGLLWRLGGPGAMRLLWLVAAGAVLVVAVLAGRSLWRLGERAPAVAAVALGALLASPISWTHHWVWVTVIVPALLTIRVPGRLAAGVLVALWSVATVGRLVWLVPHGGDREYDPDLRQLLIGNLYIYLGLATLGLLAWLSFATKPSRPLPALPDAGCADADRPAGALPGTGPLERPPAGYAGS